MPYFKADSFSIERLRLFTGRSILLKRQAGNEALGVDGDGHL
jgi:hypothetical protein